MSQSAAAAPYKSTFVVKPEWVDDNGHMNVAYYLSAFDDGGEVFFQDCGIGWDYTRQGRGTVFIANCDLDFRRELFVDERLRVETQLIDWTPKLVHTYQALYHHVDGYLAATAEMLFVHIAFADRKNTPMPSPAQERLAAVSKTHKALARPENIGRKIAIRRSVDSIT